MKMQKKLVILFILVLLAFIGLSIRLILINKENGESYKKQILSQQQYDSTTIPYKRGNIVDAKGTNLAISEKVYNLIIDSKMIVSKGDYLEATLAALKKCFSIDESNVRSYITNNITSQYYVLERKLTYNEISDFVELQNDVVTNPNIKGVWFEEEYRRVYPYNSLAGDVIGFTDTDGIGTYGLEQYYNDILTGTNGREYGYLNDDSTLERTTIRATDGETIVTTIDVNIQSIVEKYLLEFNELHRDEVRKGLGSSNTACIIMDPNSGKILAMASSPTFDLNNPKDLTQYYTEEEIDDMDESTYFDKLNQLWTNFCISSTFEPGSTMKPFTIASGIESGKLTGNETYECLGYLNVGGYTIHCHNRFGHGIVSISEALENSCNVALMKMGAAIGKDTFLKYQDAFNFGLKTNIDLAGEARTDSLVFNASTMNETELATASFGQGSNMTMIQMATAFSALINGGYYYEPHMVSKILNADGATVSNIESRILKQPISASTSEKVVEYCNAVVKGGTGKTARPAGYTMGGKTGTAEKVPRNQGKYVVSFLGYAPAVNPQVLIYVVVDEPNVAEQDSAKYATDIVRKIMTEVLPYMNIFMTEELSESEQKELLELHPYVNNSVSENTISGNATSGNSVSGNSVSSNSSNSKVVIDSATGYAIDPITGEFLDPITGEPINSKTSFMEKTGDE